MADFTVLKVTSLPVAYVPNAMYLLSRGAALLEVYVSSNDGLSARRIPTTDDIVALIQATAGTGGGAGTAVIHNTATRYEALSSVGYKVHCLSSSNIFSNLSWTRSSNSLTMQHLAHGRSVGDRVIIKNTNTPYLNALVTAVADESFTVACADSGADSGLSGKYTVGFKYAHNSEVAGSTTGGVLSMPANCDIQLHSLRVHLKANSRPGSIYDITLPTGVYHPAGINTSNDEVYVPLTQIRTDSDTMTAVGNTIAMNQAGGYSTFRLGALGATTSGQLYLMQF